MYQKSPTITIAPTNAKTKPIVIDFNGGMLTSDAGTLLLKQVEQKIQLIKQINTIINDPRDPLFTFVVSVGTVGIRFSSITGDGGKGVVCKNTLKTKANRCLLVKS